ncbi:DUF3135 domain-containing protein [Marinospirillum alkaliphilum]|uniref:DUF3135 domain-containing protein n=1 Tax=Marinospirillum alkaliphilum DSM 21637 TaxID=1122209 RepID=A0A1K1TD33_9GAMM|nr:DUF3135 domain-containing protein [Marinospirillum alkaliphilum]SFW98543.1 Protein of unknown function [Marinospirillum alkaliphilum DSM 21637]
MIHQSSRLPCFDELLTMAQQSPEQLEALRDQLTQEVLDATPDQGMRQRLEQLVFRINAERSRHRSPMALCLKFSGLMHEGLLSMRRELEKLSGSTAVEAPKVMTSAEKVADQPITRRPKVVYLKDYR